MSEQLASKSGAVISDTGEYRYSLWRSWGRDGELYKPLCWIMLNPSTADADLDDPTIRRCINFAKREGLNGIYVVNLFAYRATDPNELRSVDAAGPRNNSFIDFVVRFHRTLHVPIVAAWGAHKGAGRQAETVTRRVQEQGGGLSCLGRTKGGHPRHPLYLRKDAPLEVWP